MTLLTRPKSYPVEGATEIALSMPDLLRAIGAPDVVVLRLPAIRWPAPVEAHTEASYEEYKRCF